MCTHAHARTLMPSADPPFPALVSLPTVSVNHCSNVSVQNTIADATPGRRVNKLMWSSACARVSVRVRDSQLVPPEREYLVSSQPVQWVMNEWSQLAGACKRMTRLWSWTWRVESWVNFCFCYHWDKSRTWLSSVLTHAYVLAALSVSGASKRSSPTQRKGQMFWTRADQLERAPAAWRWSKSSTQERNLNFLINHWPVCNSWFLACPAGTHVSSLMWWWRTVSISSANKKTVN